MIKNLELTRGLIFSQTVLLKLTERGASREDAYSIVQTSAMDVWANKDKNLKDELLKSETIYKFMKKEEIEGIFDNSKLLKNVDYIFGRSVEL